MVLQPEAARKWREHAQFDYIGPFVKSWAAFNAWFRYNCGSSSDADGLNYVCTQDNPIRNTACPLIGKDNDRAEAFKGNIANLHERLLDYDLNKIDTKTGQTYSIRFSSVRVLNLGKPQKFQHAKIKYLVHKSNKVWRSEIRAKSGSLSYEFEQDDWDEDELTGSTLFKKLSQAQQSFLLTTYRNADPCPLVDLVAGGATPVQVGTYEFMCAAPDLFSGLVRILYDMRNCLLHGELVPNETALRCYEPAFWILRDFLDFADV